MLIREDRNGDTVLLAIEGRIDNATSTILDGEISKCLIRITVQKLILDFSKVEYISSAGIRVLLGAKKRLKKDRELIIRSPSEFCKQVFNVTGADIFLDIE